jgi:5-formyltetrahydrofolate cyclo-ligase
MEPVGEEMPADKVLDVVLVPGMAFDSEGNRLGRGKGYYDRFLKLLTNPRPKLIGVCFDFQKVDMVPTEPTDVKVDVVV